VEELAEFGRRETNPGVVSPPSTARRLYYAALRLLPTGCARSIQGVLQDVIDRIDIVEGYNARNRSPEADIESRGVAGEHKKPVSAGSGRSTAHIEFAGALSPSPCRRPFEGPEETFF